MGIGLLHELSARRRARSVEMPGLVFLGRADIQHIERAAPGFGAPCRQRGPVDALDIAARRDPGGGLACRF